MPAAPDPEPQVQLRLNTRSRPDAVRRARRALAAFEELQADEQLAFDTALLVSELVGNAVTHGSGSGHDAVELTAELNGERLRVQVSDSGSGFIPANEEREASLDDTSGRGLQLLRTLADRFGVETDRPGAQVWFEIDLTHIRPCE